MQQPIKASTGKLTAVVGFSGTGKSTSVYDLPPDNTAIINVKGKDFPFDGYKEDYNETKGNYFVAENYAQVIRAVNKINTSPNIKYLIIDDIGFILYSAYWARAQEGGYEKFSDIGQQFVQVLEACLRCREDLRIVHIWHPESITNGDKIVGYQLKLIGKSIHNYFTPEAVYTTILFAETDFDKRGNAVFQFITNRVIHKGVEIPAKSPIGMFNSIKIPNDLNHVLSTMDNFYQNKQQKSTREILRAMHEAQRSAL